MFSSAKKTASVNVNNQKIDTLIGPQTNINGNITSNGVVRVDGQYTGDLKTDSEVIIGETGKVIGNVTGENVTVSGVVDGNIYCVGILEILSPGKVFGDVEIGKLNVSEGAVLNGKCVMRNEELERFELDEPKGTIELPE